MLTMDGSTDLHRPPAPATYPKMNGLNGLNGKMSHLKTHVSRQTNGDQQHRHLWIITGPAGCGKTTVAQFLRDELHFEYVEGDDLHPPSNRAKMTEGIPLTDADRWDWLISVRNEAVKRLDEGLNHTGVVVTCSALKRKYRDVIRVAAYNDHGLRVHFIYLHASEAVLLSRVNGRVGHYMGSNMVKSQVESLEIPGEEEQYLDVLSCDCSGEQAEVQANVLRMVKEALDADTSSEEESL